MANALALHKNKSNVQAVNPYERFNTQRGLALGSGISALGFTAMAIKSLVVAGLAAAAGVAIVSGIGIAIIGLFGIGYAIWAVSKYKAANKQEIQMTVLQKRIAREAKMMSPSLSWYQKPYHWMFGASTPQGNLR